MIVLLLVYLGLVLMLIILVMVLLLYCLVDWLVGVPFSFVV